MSAFSFMPKRKTNKPKVQSCMIKEQHIHKRRSIPVSEVEQIVDHAIKDVKVSLTIYDDRLEILQSLERNEAHIEDLENMLHQAKLNNKRIRSDLAQVNLAITRQLELDGE